MIIKNRLFLPDNIEAILWDLDGVLLDTLTLDLTVCNQILQQHFSKDVSVSKEFIRSIFAYDIETFWKLILESVESEYNVEASEEVFRLVLEEYHVARKEAVFITNPCIEDILQDAKDKGLKLAVVSNNPKQDIVNILTLSGIINYFSLIVGNDTEGLKKKPEPDTYLHAIKEFGLSSENCAVVEDSLIGAEAGSRAGCFTVGVATGGTTFGDLEQSGLPTQVYSSFEANSLKMSFGEVMNKKIVTQNEFVSHMVEHIAWRMGCRINLDWKNNDWNALGKVVGDEIHSFGRKQDFGMALGMIDDGSTEVLIEASEKSSVEWKSPSSVDLEWFLFLRCEQISSGEPLKNLLSGIAEALQVKISVMICSVEDQHHTWESVFRAIGVALSQMYEAAPVNLSPEECHAESNVRQGNISIPTRSCSFATVERKTAESSVSVSVDFSQKIPSRYIFEVAPIVKADGFKELLASMAKEAGCSIQVDFEAQSLSSSHVLIEDIAIVLGRAFKEILVCRMINHGVNGGGSSLQEIKDLKEQLIRIGLSVEGRKFLKITSFEDSFDSIRKNFIVGHTVCNGLFSEDLDDFLTGLCEGFTCSIVVHIQKVTNPDEGWRELFQSLGKALKGAFSSNSNRQGVPPGVKATLD